MLYHVSENPSIRAFTPRMPPTTNMQLIDPVVWAVDEDRLYNYMLPRDCPRVTFQALAESSKIDRDYFFANSNSRRVVAIESAWLPSVTSTTLYIYKFSTPSFSCIDSNAGYYVSRQTIIPESMRVIDNLLSELNKMGIELRVLPELLKLAAEVSTSTLGFSCIRLRNAGRVA